MCLVFSAWESWMYKPCFLAFWYIVPCSIQWTFVIWGPVSGWTRPGDTEGSVYCRLVLQTERFSSAWHSATARKTTPEHHTGEKCQSRSWCRSVFNSSGRLGFKCSLSRFGPVAVISSVAFYHCDTVCFEFLIDYTPLAVFRAGAEWTTSLEPLSSVQLALWFRVAWTESFLCVFDAQSF